MSLTPCSSRQKSKLVSFLYICIFLIVSQIETGCAHKLPAEVKSQNYLLRLKGESGRVEQFKHHYHSYTKNFENGQLRLEKDEIVDFKTKSTVTKVAKNGNIYSSLVTLQKDGPVDLADLAFPEPGETLDFITTPTARVLKAGDHPPQSVYFIPPISVDYENVKVGDTWEMEHDWIGEHSKLPLTLNLVTVFQDIIPCGKKDKCAVFELSGATLMSKKLLGKASMQSDLRGHMILSLNRGMVVWSKINTDETLSTENGQVHVKSCMVSIMENPQEYKETKHIDNDCNI